MLWILSGPRAVSKGFGKVYFKKTKQNAKPFYSLHSLRSSLDVHWDNFKGPEIWGVGWGMENKEITDLIHVCSP